MGADVVGLPSSQGARERMLADAANPFREMTVAALQAHRQAEDPHEGWSAAAASVVVIDESEARCEYFPGALDPEVADELLEELMDDRAVAWRTHSDDFGIHDRQTAYFGDPGAWFWFVGLTLKPAAWPESPSLAAAREAAQRVALEAGAGQDLALTACLANRYDEGVGKICVHSDEVRAHGDDPCIATVSLGGPRPFRILSAAGGEQRAELMLEHGSVLVMRGRAMQERYRHELPLPDGAPARVALTLRSIVPGYEEALATKSERCET